MERVWTSPVTGTWAGFRPLWWTVGVAGELAVVLVRRQLLRKYPHTKGWVGWDPKIPFDADLLIRHRDGSVQQRTLQDIRLRPSYVALLPGARILLTSGGSRQDSTGSWPANTAVFSLESGELEGTLCLGDDITALTTDPAGRIWTLHGDEGVYGGHPESSTGLVGWDTTGQAVWMPGGQLPGRPLHGCTAATENDHVWLVWYARTDQAYLTRVTPSTGEVITWPSPVPVPDGFAVRGDRAVLTRRQHNQRVTEVIRAELHGDTWKVTDRSLVRVPGRVVRNCGQGRDGLLWLRAGNTWLRIEA